MRIDIHQCTYTLRACVFWLCLFAYQVDANDIASTIVFNKKSFHNLSHSIEAVRVKNNISAASFIIASHNKVLFSNALGYKAHTKNESKNTMAHYIRLGSVSKMFTALASLQLATESDFSINTPLKKTLNNPPYSNPWEKTYPLTVAQLLEHTAGLKGLSPIEFAHNTPLPLEQAFLVDPNSRKIAWQPGLLSSYSNTGAGIAAYAIEQYTKQNFETYVTEHVFHPLNMHSATYTLSPDVQQDLIAGYNTNGTTPIPYWHTLYRAFAGINVRTKDMGNILLTLLNHGKLENKQIFVPSIITRMETPKTTIAAKSGLTYGYGLGLYHFNRQGFSWIGHGGDADGYLSYLAYSRQLDLAYFMVINAFNKPAQNEIRELIEQALTQTALENGVKPPLPPPNFSLDALTIENLVGTYAEIAYRFGDKPSPDKLTILYSDHRLYTRHQNERQELIAVNKQHFRRAGEPVATIAIIAHDGHFYFEGDMGNFRR